MYNYILGRMKCNGVYRNAKGQYKGAVKAKGKTVTMTLELLNGHFRIQCY